MAISEKEVRGIARLARLKLTSDEVARYRTDLTSILDYMKQLEQVDSPDSGCADRAAVLVDSLREDRVESSLSTDEALQNAPSTIKNMFSVPRVIDN